MSADWNPDRYGERGEREGRREGGKGRERVRKRDGGNDRERRKSILVSEGEVRRIIGCIIFIKINTCLNIYNASFF